MADSTFDLHVRAVACTNCGAPLRVAAEGGAVTCEFCGTTNIVEMRPREAEHSRPSAAEEVARLARIAQQRDGEGFADPFDMSTAPASLEPDSSKQRLQQEFARLLAKPEAERLAADERAICWIALKLAARASASGDALEARACLEGTLDHLPDAAFRHLLRARLAVLAARAGELEAAEAWLAGCDPAPEVLSLDTIYRLARVELDLHAGRLELAHERLGMREGDEVPLDSSYGDQAALLRMAIFARGKREDKAAEILDFRASSASDFLDQAEQSGLVPELLADYRQLQAAIEARMRWAEPVSWAFVLLTLALGVGMCMLVSADSLDPTRAVFIYGACLFPLALGSSTGVGMIQAKPGPSWIALFGAALSLIPVGGIIILLVLTPFSGERNGLRQRANRAAFGGLLVGALMLTGLLTFT